MKKIFWVFFLLTILIPVSAVAQSGGLVPCGNSPDGSDACTITDFFIMLGRIYDFLVKWIATPLAILSITIGAVVLMTSAGNPSQATKGKQILMISIIGLVLVFCSWLIIQTLLSAIGYTGAWNVF
ncbi:MAG: hypothetical protein ABIJ84_04360 [bacterium]